MLQSAGVKDLLITLKASCLRRENGKEKQDEEGKETAGKRTKWEGGVGGCELKMQPKESGVSVLYNRFIHIAEDLLSP